MHRNSTPIYDIAVNSENLLMCEGIVEEIQHDAFLLAAHGAGEIWNLEESMRASGDGGAVSRRQARTSRPGMTGPGSWAAARGNSTRLLARSGADIVRGPDVSPAASENRESGSSAANVCYEIEYACALGYSDAVFDRAAGSSV